MKRIIISTICFVMVLVLCLSEGKLIEKETNPLINILNEAATLSNGEDYASTEKVMKQAVLQWEESVKFLGVILRHNELDAIDGIFAKAYIYAKNGDNPSFQVEVYELIHRLYHLNSREKFTLKNIF